MLLINCMILLSTVFNSPVVNKDSTVSFCFRGNAKRVCVQTNMQFVGEDSTNYNDLHTRKFKMKLQSDGCFHFTTRPALPETYTYCFRINGKRKPDPYNQDTAWQMIHKWNVVSIGGSPQADLYLQPELKGQLIKTHWYDNEEQQYRRVNIYLPSGYESPSTNHHSSDYPVLYLLHGINGYEGSWSERGRVIQIIENLVASHSIEPMIVVMPDCNIGKHEDRPSHQTLWNNIVHYPRLCHDHSLENALEDLMHYVDTTYRVSTKRYIAGLSSGARIAANIVNLYPGKFLALGLFSPVVYKEQLPSKNTDMLIAVYIGKDDLFINNGRRFHKRLTEKDIPHTYTETIGGHTWRNWRLYLTDFLQRVSAIEN